jgi:hypothetical protein
MSRAAAGSACKAGFVLTGQTATEEEIFIKGSVFVLCKKQAAHFFEAARSAPRCFCRPGAQHMSLGEVVHESS